LHCPGITSEDVRKSDLLAELTDVMSDGVAQDLCVLSIGIDYNPWGLWSPFTKFWMIFTLPISGHFLQTLQFLKWIWNPPTFSEAVGLYPVQKVSEMDSILIQLNKIDTF